MLKKLSSRWITTSTCRKDISNMFYPLFLNLKGKKALVVGGGRIGTKRALTLNKYGADVTVVSKEFSKELIKDHRIKLIKKDLLKDKIRLDRFFLVVTATNNPNVNDRISKLAKRNGILTNRADNHKEGDVVFRMTTKVKGHVLAFTTLGENPKVSKRIKGLIENEFSRD